MWYSEKNFTDSSLSSSEPHSTPLTKAIVQLISSLTDKTQIRLLSQYISVYKELNLKKEQTFHQETPLDFDFVFKIQDMLRNRK